MIWDPDLRSFFNANTPEALASATTLASSGELLSGQSTFASIEKTAT